MTPSLADWVFDGCAAVARVLPLPRLLAARTGAFLVRAHRFEEADRLLEKALLASPACPRLIDLYAMSAHVSGQQRIALTRWANLRSVDPNRPMAWAGIAANHRDLDEVAMAEATIREALARFPDDLLVASEAARVFDRIGAQEDACTQWQRLCALEQVLDDWYQGYACSLILVGAFDEAEAVLDRADEAYPDNRDLLGTRAFLEMERENWNAALSLWRVHRVRYPDDPSGWEGLGKTIAAIHAARAEGAIEPADALKIEVAVVDDDARRTLMLGFESLGADCEFGLVQRRFGAEPLGLLRFNDVRLSNLMRALDAGFEGMGETDRTAMIVSNSGEFYVTDTRWGLGMHTFMFSSRYDAAQLLPKMCRRVAYLRDKLLDDLRDGDKTFVFKSDAVDLDGLRALHAALLKFGPLRLLHVRRASVPLADRPFDVEPGQVVLIGPGLYVGFLSRMGNADHNWDIAFDEWAAICDGVAVAQPLPGVPCP